MRFSNELFKIAGQKYTKSVNLEEWQRGSSITSVHRLFCEMLCRFILKASI